MVDDTAITERVERAVERDVEFSVVSTDPLVVQAHSEHSDRIHTIVPEALHCSCEDDTYRGPVCYHQIALALEDDWRGATMREVIGDTFQEMQSELSMLRDRTDELQEQVEAMAHLREQIGAHTSPQSSGREASTTSESTEWSPQPTDPENVRSDAEREAEAAAIVEEMADSFDSKTRRNSQQSGDVGEETSVDDDFEEMVADLQSD